MNKERYRIVQFCKRNLANVILLPVILLLSLGTNAEIAPATPAILMGVITNGANGVPVVGAKVVVNGNSTYSTSGGIYSLSVDPVGTFPVNCSKAGFDAFTSPPVVFQQGVTSQQNIVLWEALNAPASVTAVLDTIPQSVGVSWTAPSGDYELLYDDGIQDNFTIWSSQGNMNAVKFTPVGYPAQVTGGSINIGNSTNYPSGGNPLVPFQVSIYDATGTGGAPGNFVAGPFTIAPLTLGWVEFTLPYQVLISSGSFYLVMIQAGTPPNCAGIAIDETNPQFRSYLKFVNGSSPWMPAAGNFMMRAKCEGPGGPVSLSDEPATSGFYNVFRLRQGEEQNPVVWTFLAATATNTVTDNSWSSLPCGPYRWGVKAQYTGNRWSPVTFSNILGKCWTAPMTIHVNPSCESNGHAGATLSLVNLAHPDTVYAALTDTTGIVSFPHVWKGTYQLTVIKFGYDTLLQTVSVTAPVNMDAILLQVKLPPANLVVNDSSLLAHWDVPHFEKPLYSEQWNSGSLTTNGWTILGGANWQMSSTMGSPPPCATFTSVPRQTDYNQSLISRTISGERSTLLKLKYDILLDNAGSTTVNQMAVELWDGNAWNTLKNYTNSGGNLPWTNEEIDISAYSDLAFKIRFRAYGIDSYDINNWNIDNIDIIASEPAQEQANCILGYYFYLGNVICGYTLENVFHIPENQVQFGHTYNACVRALYGSGYSGFACTSFTSHFLFPVRNLHGNPLGDTAYMAWDKPQVVIDTSSFTPPGLVGYSVYRDDSLIAQINDPDSLAFYDAGLEPGTYLYKVSAKYDLTAYGFPGQFGESFPEGPLQINVNFGRQLPFFEPWDQIAFSYNDWRFTPLQGNWVVDPNEGMPSPTACFRWQPPQVNYNYALESPALNGVPFECAEIWLDFDLKLSDRNATGAEKMIVEAYYNNGWHKKAEIENNGSLAWTNYHIDISLVRGNGFRIRFRASGANSADILGWEVDNIHVYAICLPATNLTGEALGNEVQLDWSPPQCNGGGSILQEGFEEPGFPPDGWERTIHNPSATWSHTGVGSPIGVRTGNYSAGLFWDYNRQNEWIIARNVFVNGNLKFWSMAYQGSSHGDHYYVKVSTDHGNTWETLMDLSALPPYPGPGGYNQWQEPYIINMSAWLGDVVDIAWHADDNNGQGLWYYWGIDDCSMGDKKLAFSPDPFLYDVYRQNPSGGDFIKVNNQPLSDTAYTDPMLPAGYYKYYIRIVNSACSVTLPSDTVSVDVITSAGRISEKNLHVFPNPATDWIRVKSDVPVTRLSLFNLLGMKVAETSVPCLVESNLRLDNVTSGQYILKIYTANRTKEFLISVVK